MNRLTRVIDYAAPILGGLAGWAHCLLDDDRLARWLRTNPDHEPDAIG